MNATQPTCGTSSRADRIKVLFLCTGNSCRSQMAEGWARQLKAHQVEPYSAGTEPGELNPLAVQVMAEAGVDISPQTSKGVGDLGDLRFDHVVTVCSHAHEACPVLPGYPRLTHAGFQDPPRLAAEADSQEEVLDCYRLVRDQIKAFVLTLPEALDKS